MTLWQMLCSVPPLVDERDVMARIGFRFLWCTGPYFIVAAALSAFGNAALLANPAAFFMAAIPVLGGLHDWRRIRSRSITA